MATTSRFSVPAKAAEADILAGVSMDRLNLRFSVTFVPCNYLYEADGVTPVLNAAGEKAVVPVGGSFTFVLGLARVFQLQTANAEALRADPALTWDAVQTSRVEAMKDEAVAEWDRLVAAQRADPTLPQPTVEQVAAHVGAELITGDHPFVL